MEKESVIQEKASLEAQLVSSESQIKILADEVDKLSNKVCYWIYYISTFLIVFEIL